MKSRTKFFAGLKSHVDLDKVEDFSGHETHSHNHAHQQTGRYQCPMECEGNKTYDQPGNCPVCNMKLVPESESTSHGNHHHHCC